ncbi:hypothetical protein A3F02_03200 [Candidatus Curtissbacteria bacterium RIFCSPHIGHO2_12_FULL_38_9b]|uniref:F-type ATPase subunit b n=1 Tax=Candidatus Curtissbacteria bacterium RIFCSPHIGHO2_12_FULL_38_9b TaxID=1797720 RepID=A0A1F5GWC4_9BACT|nr:MAG: hypothetical protein A3F02_03200 [Candidatus Curtissbacteria bacterium RIFCSPHIGHO2_12_FULL_38_9b]
MEFFIILTGLFNLAVLVLIILLYPNIWKIIKEIKKLEATDAKIKDKAFLRAQSKADKELSKVIRAYSAALNLETKKQIEVISGETARQIRDLAEFSKEQKETIVSQTRQSLVDDIQKTQKDIENYRKVQIEKLNNQINSVIAEVARKVLSKTIDLKTHQDLVIDALNKAKAEKLF